jgi:O-antigen/teichoic acid export membrane protein
VRVAEIWVFVPVVFFTNIYPLLTQAHYVGTDRFARVQGKALKVALAYALPITAGLLVFAQPIIGLLFGTTFGPSVGLLQLLAINVTLVTAMELLWRSVSARGRQSTVLRVQIVVSCLWLCVAVTLIAPLGSLGAAVSTPLRTVMLIVALERAIRTTGAPIRLIRTGWPFAVAAGAMAAASWLLSQWFSIWVVAPIAAAIYVAGIIAIRAFPPEDIRTLRGLLPWGAAPTTD